MRENFTRHTSALVGDSDDDVLGRFTDEDFDRGWFAGHVSLPFDDCLYRVPQQLADNVLQMAQNVRKGGVEVALELDVWYGAINAVGFSGEGLGCVSTSLHYFFSVTSEKDFADKVCVGFYVNFGVWEVPWCIEGLC